MTAPTPAAADPGRGPRSAPAVERAFRLLEIVRREPEALGASELARRLSLSKGSVHALLTALVRVEALEAHGPQRRYRLGPLLHTLGQHPTETHLLRDEARPLLREITRATNETALLGEIRGDHVVIVERQQGEHALSVSAALGTRVPLVASGIVKAVLAAIPAEQRAAFLAEIPLRRFTTRSPGPQQLLAAAAATERLGYAIDEEEYLEGVSAVAGAITAGRGHVVAVIYVVGFTVRLTPAAWRRAGRLVGRAAAELSTP